MSLFPLATFDEISLGEANEKLRQWEHKMGELRRPNFGDGLAHGLSVDGELVAVVTSNQLISARLGDPIGHITRDNALELSRLCASGSFWNRVALRLWREIVFRGSGRDFAVSYQDKNLHTGATYRNDGWKALAVSSSGTDARSGAKGRSKRIWVWERRPPEKS